MLQEPSRKRTRSADELQGRYARPGCGDTDDSKRVLQRQCPRPVAGRGHEPVSGGLQCADQGAGTIAAVGVRIATQTFR